MSESLSHNRELLARACEKDKYNSGLGWVSSQAKWLRSSVVSVLISLKTGMLPLGACYFHSSFWNAGNRLCLQILFQWCCWYCTISNKHLAPNKINPQPILSDLQVCIRIVFIIIILNLIMVDDF